MYAVASAAPSTENDTSAAASTSTGAATTNNVSCAGLNIHARDTGGSGPTAGSTALMTKEPPAATLAAAADAARAGTMRPATPSQACRSSRRARSSAIRVR